jgi:Skp family chaperone for outer membrane proteins
MYYIYVEHDGKKYYIGTKEHFEDYLREVCGEEVFEAYRNLVMGDSNSKEIENLKKELDSTEYMRDRHERIADGYYNQLNEVYRLCQEFREEVDNSSRLNRKKIMRWINTIERESQ